MSSNTGSRFFDVTIQSQPGVALLMHNGQLADPLSPFSKLIKGVSSGKKKSDADHEKLGELEYQGSLYFEESMGPYIPGDMLDATIQSGGKKKKLGKSIATSVRVLDDVNPLKYKGPRTREGLWANEDFRDRRPVKVQMAKVVRTRPKFSDWSLDFCVEIFPSELNPSDVETAIKDAGIYSGLGDYRPRFGLFKLVKFEEVSRPATAEAAE